jgi:hypothetical protein
MLVKQTALSKEIYNYWKKLKEANEEAGSMYDKVPSQIFGNIKCCNGKEQALGYFTASAVRAKRIFINPTEHGVETRNAFDGCTFGFFIPRVANYYLGHIIAVGNKKYTNVIGAKIYST